MEKGQEAQPIRLVILHTRIGKFQNDSPQPSLVRASIRRRKYESKD